MIPGVIHVAVSGATAGGPLQPEEGGVGGLVVLALVAVLWAAGYLVACALWPFRRCWWCQGKGHRYSPSGKARGKCRHGCQGGWKLRAGRRAIEWWRA